MIPRRYFCFVAAFAALLEIASATDQIVTDTGDNGGPNQLRAKLNAAQSSGGGTITFNVGNNAIIILSSVLPGISSNVTIDGGGAVSLSGNNATILFNVNSGATLTLNNLTVTHGFASLGDGGAIRNSGTLNINNCNFNNNQTTSSWSGGAILSLGALNITNSDFGFNTGGNGGALYPRFPGAVVTITGSTFHDNQAINTSSGWGGAILAWDGASLTCNHSTFQNNTTHSYGGAIYLQGMSSLSSDRSNYIQNAGSIPSSAGGAIYCDNGSIDLTGAYFSQNHNGNGGAIYMNNGYTYLIRSSFDNNWASFGGAYQQAAGTLYVDDCTFDLNGYNANLSPTTINGGGIVISGGSSGIYNSTFSRNYGSVGGGMLLGGIDTLENVTISGNASSQGGGITAFNGSISLTNVTIYANTASNGRGGITHSNGESISAINTIVANNTGGNCDAVLTNNGFNLSNDATCGFGPGHDNVVNINLDPLADNGGLTQTQLPHAGSAAIDSASGNAAPGRDQRGYVRAGAAADVGAAEYNGTPTPVNLTTAASRKTHGNSGTYDINLPLSGTPGVECRGGGNYAIVFTFSIEVARVGSIALSAAAGGTISDVGIGADAHQYIVSLSGIGDQQTIRLTLGNVVDAADDESASVPISVGILLGDVNGDRVVNSGDSTVARNNSGQTANATNFRSDLNADGVVNSADATIARNHSGAALPPGAGGVTSRLREREGIISLPALNDDQARAQ